MSNDLPFVFLKGNPGDGFTAFGPYEDADDAFTAHDYEEGWLMTLYPAQIELGETG